MATTATQREKPQSSHLLPPPDFSSPTTNPFRRNPEMLAGKQRSAPRPAAPDRRLPLPQIKDLPIGDGAGGLREFREKLLGHLREAADKICFEMPPIGAADAPTGVEETDRPWNLRLRTNAKRTSPAAAAPPPERTMRLRSECSERKRKEEEEEEEEKGRFSVSLSREEIEEDLFALTGSRPKRRPKKRPRNVQLQLDGLFPGLGLSEITPELYKVDEE